MGKKLLLFIVACFVTIKLSAQCGQTETIVICDITQIDNNNDGTPDGILDLAQEYTNQTGNTLPVGTWFDPDFNFVLNSVTGVVNVWDIDDSTVESVPLTDPIDYYEYQLFTTGCGSVVPAVTIQVHLGAFSGVPAQSIVICDIGTDPCGSIASIDLFAALNADPVSPHANGVWTYDGYDGVNPPEFADIGFGSIFVAQIPYVPNDGNLEDTITFNFTYTVPGVAPCNIEMQTQVKVTVSREISSGFANRLYICESDLVAGNYNQDINLLEDSYLVAEDIEGTWSSTYDPTNQISNPGDSQVNLEVVYNNLVQSNPKFGCQFYSYDYEVLSHSTTPMCTSDKTSTVEFVFFEYLRPFQQNTNLDNEFCIDESSSTINLYNHLEFTNENGLLFDYPINEFTNWSFVSGPSSLGISNSGNISVANLPNSAAGTYVFQYTVQPEYNCPQILNILPPFPKETIFPIPNGCLPFENNNHPCQPESAQVTIVIHPKNYAGEDTNGLEFCLGTNISSPIDLITLLNTDPIQDPIYVGPLGTWTNTDTGLVIINPYTLPTINGQQTFNFIYNTDTLLPIPDGCPDEATLSFTVYEPNDPGVGTPQDLCTNNGSVNLFDLLSWNPDNNGTWTGPNGYIFSNNLGTIDTAVADSGDYTYTVPANGTCPEASTTFYVTIYEAPNTGADQMPPAICSTVNTVDLLLLIDSTADTGGTFVDVSGTGMLSGSVVTVTNLTAGTYDFEYQIQGNVACNLQISTITLTIETSLNPGTAMPVVVCSDGNVIDLFNSLTGSPNTSGTWTGPGAYTTATNSAMINPAVNISGNYVYTVPVNGSCPSAQVSVNLTINPAPEAGSDQTETVCQSDGVIDLNTLIDPMADGGGIFYDLDATGMLTGNMFDVSGLLAGTYNFTYELPATAICNSDTASLSVTVLTVLPPDVINQFFCVNLGATVSNLLILNAEDHNWYDTATSTIALADDLLLINAEDYFVSAVDSSGCESGRVQVIVTLLPLSNANCDDGVADGVSDNNDGENDTLDIGGLPLAYPNFEIQIFNRYGTIVYKGNINTNPFDGSGNVSLTLGEKLPTGVYFYVFNPKDGVTEPFQGDFYLSR